MDFAYGHLHTGEATNIGSQMTGIDDAKAIEGVIQSYLDGLHEGDAAKIASAFHPTSALTSISEAGELAITPRDVWLENVRNRPSPKQRSLPRHDEVLSIDLVGPTMAPTSNSDARSRHASSPINSRC